MDLNLSQAETRFLLVTLLSVLLLAHLALLVYMARKRVNIHYAGILLASIIYSGLWVVTVIVSILAPSELIFGFRSHFGIGMMGFLYLFVVHFPIRPYFKWRYLILSMPAFILAALALLPNALVSDLQIVGYGYQREWNGWLYPYSRFSTLVYFFLMITGMLFQCRDCVSDKIKLIWRQVFVSVIVMLGLSVLFVGILPWLGFGASTQLTPFAVLAFLMTVATIIAVYPELQEDINWHHKDAKDKK